jgi:hypothetical protein
VHPQPCNYLLWVIRFHGRCPWIKEGEKTNLFKSCVACTFSFTFWTLNGFSHVINTLKGLSPICLFQFSSVSKQGIKIQESWERVSFSISVEWMLYADCEVYLTGWVQWSILGGVRKQSIVLGKVLSPCGKPCSWPPWITFFCPISIRQENCRPSWFVKITKNDTRSHASASAYRKMSLSTPSVFYTVMDALKTR